MIYFVLTSLAAGWRMDWQGWKWIGRGKNGSKETQAITVDWVTDNKAQWQIEVDVGRLDVGVKEKLILRFWTSATEQMVVLSPEMGKTVEGIGGGGEEFC